MLLILSQTTHRGLAVAFIVATSAFVGSATYRRSSFDASGMPTRPPRIQSAAAWAFMAFLLSAVFGYLFSAFFVESAAGFSTQSLRMGLMMGGIGAVSAYRQRRGFKDSFWKGLTILLPVAAGALLIGYLVNRLT
jgi:hypothetical protein